MNKREQEIHNAHTDVSWMGKAEDKRCGQVAELFRPFLDSLGDACIVRAERFGYIVLAYFVDGRFEDNDVFDNAQDLFDFLVDKWHFRWICDKAKENGVEEFEDYEDSLTGEQKKEREHILTGYRQAFEKIVKDE